jgi:hypothetical protein
VALTFDTDILPRVSLAWSPLRVDNHHPYHYYTEGKLELTQINQCSQVEQSFPWPCWSAEPGCLLKTHRFLTAMQYNVFIKEKYFFKNQH